MRIVITGASGNVGTAPPRQLVRGPDGTAMARRRHPAGAEFAALVRRGNIATGLLP